MTPDVTTKVHDFYSKYPRREYPKGQILVFAKENPEHIFYMTAGRVRKYDVSYRGDEVIINVFQPPAYFPMSWTLSNIPNKYFYKAETNVTLHVIPCDDAMKFLKGNPDVVFDLLDRLYKSLEGFYGRMVNLMSGTAKNRLLYEMIIECRRFGELQTDGSRTIDSNESDLAARSGLSRETISREMKKLKDMELVSISKSKLHIRDLAALETAFGSEV